MLAGNDENYSCQGDSYWGENHYVVFGEVNGLGPTVAGVNAEEKNKNDNTQDKKNNAGCAEKHSQSIVLGVATHKKYVGQNNNQKKYVWHVFFHFFPVGKQLKKKI